MDATALASRFQTLENSLHVGSLQIPWSVIFVAIVIIVGLAIMRSAFTLIKVAIFVGIAVVVFLLVKFVVSNWLPN